MKLTIRSRGPLSGVAIPPGDKSISHRAILFSALAEGESQISNLLVAGVTRVMLAALQGVGVSWRLEETSLTVQGRGLGGWRTPNASLDCGNSATTLRLLAGALAATGTPAVLDGSLGLRRRPMRRIVEPLKRMGVSIESIGGRAPLILRRSAARLRPLDYDLPVASAQLKSCLLLAALAANGPTTLREPGPSRDHTERMLGSMGVSISSVSLSGAEGNTVTLTPVHPLRLAPLRMNIPGDISAAAFLIVGALITPGSEITLVNVGLNPTRTGLLDALLAMGADIQLVSIREQHGEPVGDLVVRYSRLRGTEVSGPLVVRMIDEFPAFAVAASTAQGATTVMEATELRHKESDRIAVLCQELRKLGVEVSEHADGFTLAGGSPPRGGVVEAHGDHRLAMSLAVAGLVADDPVSVTGAEVIEESFPSFVETLNTMGADMRQES